MRALLSSAANTPACLEPRRGGMLSVYELPRGGQSRGVCGNLVYLAGGRGSGAAIAPPTRYG
jgi:hypothetical protein